MSTHTAPDSPTVDLAVRGTAVLAQGLVPDALVLVDGERITWAGPASQAPPHEAARTLAHDGLILPGLVDLHCHGGGGESFPDATGPGQMLTAVREHRRHGTTSLVASLVTADAATLRARVADLARLAADGEIAALHLEGPFLSVARRGAQNPEHIVAGDTALVRELADLAGGALATMTVAPEVEGSDAVLEVLAEVGALPSLGHTDGSSASMTRAVGLSGEALRRHRGRSPRPTATHLFNGMRPIHHRDPGPALAALDAAARGELVVEVIADGVHLDARTVAHVFALAAEDAVVLVTDAMAAAGMPEGQYRLGSLDVTVEAGVATLTDGGAIAGGTAHLLDVVRFAVLEAGVDLVRAVRAASATPAEVLGMQDRIGTLAAGRRADAVLVDERLAPVTVLRGGALVAD
ncbi:N-acetylglucosamine-6-phosphate deacetylase [Brachybacterium saurashtrense]|uniref:N-acetylglucosamine-6-phosphate deacetylase n=1 Tax=Brachybacterium saurashtrense TaxID=556288 RepID=A0A345YN84_9MICO|nr:amidohydrolase family protein [Brachybacterium saurashtrense]AXK45386.1 N-acetylglucosamine-6-phosphate deacetylase [Brachybacterium saurashtrense]RRR21857.1 N-acetylglucosamine-6-phosphate deacetylase [Brachybacterium saurashtrense]